MTSGAAWEARRAAALAAAMLDRDGLLDLIDEVRREVDRVAGRHAPVDTGRLR